ncbi:ParB/RepB/Spo0J family partition protein [Streptomyces alkaliphilus]|uniref:ParB/RepB/Spo0J family partition protein n=1 Tax=Streptomyces alkaliphilus TaxID=1472722 RepID=A0A7W3TFD8_9ACTN|nr:ParB/RepB/Spo0J family partition protein [Streptomyces alkaliphilus]MBB0245505.1 ParB/RepB/Spo0J family partition protein [Streptomyces alkaliphilus]
MSKADRLGAGTSFGRARPVSARRAAIGAATGAPTVGVPDPTELPLKVISHNPDNPREELRDLEGLAQSVEELGVINAITVAGVDAYLKERPERAGELDEGAHYIVVDGHRRLEAARRAGLEKIRVQVDDARVATDESLLETAFVANFQRDDMTDLEQAHALEALVTFYGSQTKAARRLGISQATISSKLSLLKLSPELQADLAAGRRQVEHVRNLGKLAPEEQRAAADARAASAKSRRPVDAPPVVVEQRTGEEVESPAGSHPVAPRGGEGGTPVTEGPETGETVSGPLNGAAPAPAPRNPRQSPAGATTSARATTGDGASAPAENPVSGAVQRLVQLTADADGLAEALTQHLPEDFLEQLTEALIKQAV